MRNSVAVAKKWKQGIFCRLVLLGERWPRESHFAAERSKSQPRPFSGIRIGEGNSLRSASKPVLGQAMGMHAIHRVTRSGERCVPTDPRPLCTSLVAGKLHGTGRNR